MGRLNTNSFIQQGPTKGGRKGAHPVNFKSKYSVKAN